MSREAMKLALEKFAKVKKLCDKHGSKINRKHIYGGALVEHFDVVCQALAEQPAQQEPVAWTATRLWNRRELWTCPADIERDLVEGYASPPAQRKPLTDEQIVAKALHLSGLGTSPDVIQFARAIEAAIGIKENT